MPHQHRHSEWEPLPEVRYVRAPRQSRQRRPSMTVGIVSGFFRYVQAGVIIFMLLCLLLVAGVWAFFAYAAPALPGLGDKVSEKLEQIAPSTTSTTP